jgi:predicted neutral ceramidase superfamily lipid hydrolase
MKYTVDKNRKPMLIANLMTLICVVIVFIGTQTTIVSPQVELWLAGVCMLILAGNVVFMLWFTYRSQPRTFISTLLGSIGMLVFMGMLLYGAIQILLR